MHGFQPLAQRGLAHHATNPQHLADGGQVGFGARGLSQLREMIPKMAAMGYQQGAPAPAPVAAAPAVDPRNAQVQAMIPQMEAMGFKQQRPQYLAKGGVVRGPGTGTSDSIETEAEPGTFIMPADSTEAIGPSALEQMGTVPVRLSDGEFKLPPEQVMALGTAVLKLMKDATHAPVNGKDGGQTDDEVAEARGFAPGAAERMAQAPEQMFADGGTVDPLQRPTSFGDAAAVASDPSTTQVRTSAADTFGTAAPAPAPAAPQPALGSNLAAATRMTSFSDPRSTMYDPNPYAASNADKLAASGQSSRATVEAGMPPAPAPVTAGNSFGDASAATRDASVTQVASGFQPGRGTVSTVPAAPVAAGFQTAAQRMAAAPAPAAPLGWSDRNAQRNAEVTAASITNRPEWSKTPRSPRAAPPPEPPPPAPPPVDSRVTFPDSTFQSRAAYGFQPRRYADGGMVEDRAVFGFYPQLTDHGKTTRATQDQLQQGVQATGPSTFQPAAPAAEPAPLPAAQRMTNLTDPRSTQFAGAPSPDPAPAPTPAPGGALSRAAQMGVAPAPQQLAQGPISAQNMGAADSLARRGAADAMARMPNAPAPVQAPTVLTSENSWQKRNDLRNALVSASSITANGGRFDRHKGESPESLTYRAMLATDQGLQGSAPALAQQAMREQGDTQRAGMLTEGAMDRTALQEQGLNLRAVIEARRNGQPPAGYQWAPGGGLTHIPGGPADPNVRGNKAPLNDVQSKALQFGTRMQVAGGVLDKLAAQGVNQPGLIKRSADAVGLGAAANWTQSGEQQQVEQSQRDFINAVLRRESGAAIADSEFSNARQQYFPQPGDTPEVIAQKRQNREIATAGVLAEVPDSEKRVNQVLTQANSNPQPATQSGAQGQPQRVDTQQAFAALPSGARFVAPDGTVRIKP